MPKGIKGFQKGHKHFKGMDDKKHSETTKKKMSESRKKYLLKHPKTMKKRNNPNWKGGTKKNCGYWFIYNPNHPRTNLNKIYVKRAILVAEKCLGRPLTKEEVVHHISGIKDDDRPENLYLFSSGSKHTIYENSKNKSLLESNLI